MEILEQENNQGIEIIAYALMPNHFPRQIPMVLFLTNYQNLSSSNLNQKITFRNAEFKVYSKHGCDGILAHIFSNIGKFCIISPMRKIKVA